MHPAAAPRAHSASLAVPASSHQLAAGSASADGLRRRTNDVATNRLCDDLPERQPRQPDRTRGGGGCCRVARRCGRPRRRARIGHRDRRRDDRVWRRSGAQSMAVRWYARTHIYACARARARTHAPTHTYAYARAHMRSSAHTRTHTHTRMRARTAHARWNAGDAVGEPRCMVATRLRAKVCGVR
jgi:hypothetical protein